MIFADVLESSYAIGGCDALRQVVYTFIEEFFVHAPSHLRRCLRCSVERDVVHQVSHCLLLCRYICSLRMKEQNTKASVLPSLSPTVLSVLSQLPPSLPAQRWTEIFSSNAASLAVIPYMLPLSPYVSLAHYLLTLLTLPGPPSGIVMRNASISNRRRGKRG